LGRADVVTLHLPLTPQTRHLIGREELALMKPEAMLVNTARGGLIDEAALYQALAAGRPAGAALDAYEIEPPGDSPLLGLDNLLHSPHTAWFTAEALSRMNRRSAEQLIEIHQGRRPDNLVNPEAFGVGR
jgi:phosphoglycerate dehydrogenase-like enzyme